MAFRFQRKESVAAGFARVAGEQIAGAITALEKDAGSGAHDARKCIKRLRALLRLFRRALPGGCYERESDALRAAARHLSALRDAQVRLAVFNSIAKNLNHPGVAELRRDFATAVARAGGAQPPLSPTASPCIGLRVLAARLPGVKPDAGWSVLARGIRRAYRRARKAHAVARAELSTEALHAWRRRSKDFEYQLELLRKIDPRVMKPRLRKVARLNDRLGDIHDLAMLDHALIDARGIPSEVRGKLRARIARRRKKLQRRAFDMASALFFARPGDVVKELGRQWKRWRRGKEGKE